jgi:transcription elongation factor GreA-like protein
MKRVLTHAPTNQWARAEIVESFRNKFADHSNLEEYIQISNVAQNWRPVHEAIADFEKHIAFDTGNFVFHRSWGIGRIRMIDGDSITIDFAKKRGHTMSLKMAVNALDVLPKDHIWVLRAVWKKDKLHTLVKKNIEWALKTVIRSLGNAADMKKIKSELVPAILTQGEWSSWSTKARQILKTNPDFGTLTDKADHFVVRDQPITFEEKIYNKFRAEKDFFDRIKTIEEFLAYVEKEGGDGIDSEFFREMFEFFAGFIRNASQIDEYVVASELVLNTVVARFPFLNADIDLDFQRIYSQIEDIETVFARLNSADLRKRFLSNVRGLDKNWGEIYARLLPYHLSRDILVDLEKHGKRDLILDFIGRVYENYRDMRETFVWLVKTCASDPWFDEIGITEEKQLIALIHILDLTFRDIDNRKDVSANRKINKQVQSYLFKDDLLHAFLDRADEDSLTRIISLISDVKEMDPKILLDLKQHVIDRFPDFHFYGEDAGPELSTRKVLYCTPSSYNAKQEEYTHLQQVEVPQNSKEIETAR